MKYSKKLGGILLSDSLYQKNKIVNGKITEILLISIFKILFLTLLGTWGMKLCCMATTKHSISKLSQFDI